VPKSQPHLFTLIQFCYSGVKLFEVHVTICSAFKSSRLLYVFSFNFACNIASCLVGKHFKILTTKVDVIMCLLVIRKSLCFILFFISRNVAYI